MNLFLKSLFKVSNKNATHICIKCASIRFGNGGKKCIIDAEHEFVNATTLVNSDMTTYQKSQIMCKFYFFSITLVMFVKALQRIYVPGSTKVELHGFYRLPILELNKPFCVKRENDDQKFNSKTFKMYQILKKENEIMKELVEASNTVIYESDKLLRKHKIIGDQDTKEYWNYAAAFIKFEHKVLKKF